ncbi:hypothetical protein IAT38_001050 [Cryptococcus sp. DSM 104549]
MVTPVQAHSTPPVHSQAHSRAPSAPHNAQPPRTIHPPPHPNATPGAPIPPPPQSVEHVIPTFYPFGGKSYIWEGKGIFVDPHTGIGLSLWVDPSLSDAMEIIRRIWGEGGHISPFHDNAATQLLIINPKSSLIRDTYCHPPTSPYPAAANPSLPPLPPPPRRAHPPTPAPRHAKNHGSTKSCSTRIGGPVNVTTMPYPPMARLKGLEARELGAEGMPVAAIPAVVPMGLSAGQPQAPGPGAAGNQGKANGHAPNGHAHPRGGAAPAPLPVNQYHQRAAARPASGPSSKPHPTAEASSSKRTSRAPTPPKATRKKRGPNKKHDTARPSTSRAAAAAAAAALALGDDSESPLTSINSSDEEDEDSELSQEDAESVLEIGGPAEASGTSGGRLYRRVMSKGATLGEIAEVFRIEMLAFGPGVRDSYIVAQLKKKYNTYSQATWRDLYLSYLYQEGQFVYLKQGGSGGSDKPIPVEDLDDPDLPSSKRRKLEKTSAEARYLNPSTLSWAEVSLTFEKESPAIGAAGLSVKEAGEYLAEKYGVYIAPTWTAYFIRWHKQKSGRTLEKASPPRHLPQPRQSGAAHSRARSPQQARGRAPPSESESDDDDVEDALPKTQQKGASARGAVEFMTNDKIVSIFKHVKPKYEQQGLSRAEIAEALAERYGVYTTSSWSLYWSSWKAGRGRFAPQSSTANKLTSSRRRTGAAAASLPTPPPKVRRPPPTARQALPKEKDMKIKHSFTEEEERAMAAYVVKTGQETVLPSYLTWQAWAKNTEGFPVRTPSSYATHCWKFRDRMEQLVAEAKGLPEGKPWHGELKKRGPERGSDSEGEGDEGADEDMDKESEEEGGPEVLVGEEEDELDSEGEGGEGGGAVEVEMEGEEDKGTVLIREGEEVDEDMVDAEAAGV